MSTRYIEDKRKATNIRQGIIARQEDLDVSIEIGSVVWKDVSDAGKYIRDKRDARTCPTSGKIV